MRKAKFKIGDKVKVTNFGQTYTIYEYMFDLMGFKNTLRNWALNNREVGTIFGVQLHENQDVILYAVRTADDKEALIGEEGLVKVEDAPKVYSEEDMRISFDANIKDWTSFEEFIEQFKKRDSYD